MALDGTQVQEVSAVAEAKAVIPKGIVAQTIDAIKQRRAVQVALTSAVWAPVGHMAMGVPATVLSTLSTFGVSAAILGTAVGAGTLVNRIYQNTDFVGTFETIGKDAQDLWNKATNRKRKFDDISNDDVAGPSSSASVVASEDSTAKVQRQENSIDVHNTAPVGAVVAMDVEETVRNCALEQVAPPVLAQGPVAATPVSMEGVVELPALSTEILEETAEPAARVQLARSK